jgi:WD40-like Beta Propeller Repeat
MRDTRTHKTHSTITVLALVLLAMFSAPRVEAVNGPFNGKIAFHSNRGGDSDIFTMNANGTTLVNVSNHPALEFEPAWSPDGTRIAFTSDRDGDTEIYVMNADGTGQTRLTNSPGIDDLAAWSPDGTKIAFRSQRDGDGEIYVMNADGTGVTRLTNSLYSDTFPSWSPDGTKITFQSSRGGDSDIYVMNADGTGQTSLTNNSVHDLDPSFSPDGTKIVFTSFFSGTYQVVLMNSNGTSPTQLTFSGVNHSPAFSPDGDQITFVSNRDAFNVEIYVMDADGSNQDRLTDDTLMDLAPSWQPIPKLDTIGVFRPSTGQFFLRNFNSAGAPNLTITFGQVNDQPLAGDWNGSGKDNVGVFRNGQFLLRQPRTFGLVGSTIIVNFGLPGDLAIVGDWNGDGIDTPGVFRPSTGQFLLTNAANVNNSSPPASVITFSGQSGDKPVAGDWNGDGLDTVGVYRESQACAFLLTNNNFSINIIATGFCAGNPVAPINADWNGNGFDTLGLYTIPQAVFSLSNRLTGPPEFQVAFGQPGDLPVAGDWNGGSISTEP